MFVVGCSPCCCTCWPAAVWYAPACPECGLSSPIMRQPRHVFAGPGRTAPAGASGGHDCCKLCAAGAPPMLSAARRSPCRQRRLFVTRQVQPPRPPCQVLVCGGASSARAPVVGLIASQFHRGIICARLPVLSRTRAYPNFRRLHESPIAAACAALLPPAFPFPAHAQVTVKDPWVRATVSQQKATGAFMQLTSAQDCAPRRSQVAGCRRGRGA
jgi:hypothetical protein